MDLHDWFPQGSTAVFAAVTPKGWECPKCGRVYATSFPMCSHCPGKTTTSPSANPPYVQQPSDGTAVPFPKFNEVYS